MHEPAQEPIDRMRLYSMPLIEYTYWGPSNQHIRDTLRGTTPEVRQQVIDDARSSGDEGCFNVALRMMATAEVAALLLRMGVVSPQSPRVRRKAKS